MSNFSFILERLSSRAKNSLIAAQLLSEEQRCNHIGTEHLLYGILAEHSSFGAEILDRSKLSPEVVKEEVLTLNKQHETSDWKPALSENLKVAIEKAALAASQFNYQFIGTEHFLYGLVASSSRENRASEILRKLGIEPKELEKQLLAMFEHIARFPDLAAEEQPANKGNKRSRKSALEYFTTDLTQMAKEGKLTPLIGRKTELERLISILGRKTKNNPVLIGDAGVGKTAIVEGLAQMIWNKQAPESLMDLRLLSLDLTLMVAGAMFRGEFESRFKQLLDEAGEEKNVILFIDELHMLVGAGSGGGSMDAANILKPALARGELKLIGATTLSEYKQFIERDSALERRFQPIMVDEPGVDDSVKILLGVKSAYEQHHRLQISDEAIHAAVELSNRYIADRRLPDKAVDILDETAAILRMQNEPSSLLKHKRELENNLIQLELEKQKAVMNQDFATALHLQGQEGTLKAQLEAILKQLQSEANRPGKMIGADDIARTISVITKVPVQKLTRQQGQELQDLEKRLGGRVVGQSEAVSLVAKAVRRGRLGLSDQGRPLASFLFAGPSGVGKTELARALAEEIYENPKALIRVDMSELSERHTVSRLIGAPAGYVGFGEGGMLTESVRRKPYSIVLLDEIEKAHPDVANILLQILEDGHLTDGQGKTVNFRNTIVILTSNVGAPDPGNLSQEIGFSEKQTFTQREIQENDYHRLRDQVEDAAKKFFRPELLNRLDHVVIFRPLGREQIRQIVKLQIGRLQSRLAEQNINFSYTPDILKLLAEESFDPSHGARKVRTSIRELLEDPIADKLIQKRTIKQAMLQASVVNDRISLDLSTLAQSIPALSKSDVSVAR